MIGPRQLIGLALGLTLLVAVLMSAFAWPPSELEPRDLPVVVVGTDQVAEEVRGRLGADDDAFDLAAVPDRRAAVSAIEDRDAYAAVVPAPDGPPEVLVAGAASPTVAQLMTQHAQALGAARVTDLVPPPEDDARGVTFNSGALPLVLAGLLVGAACALVVPTPRQRVAVGLSVSALGGLALAGILQAWLGALDGSYLANAGVVGLGIAAIGMTVVGLNALVGRVGIALAGVLMLLIGNPLSGITTAPDLLPLGWLGQLLPPGATGSALRSTAFFDAAGAGEPLLVLACWAVVGTALALVPGRREAAAPETVTASGGTPAA